MYFAVTKLPEEKKEMKRYNWEMRMRRSGCNFFNINCHEWINLGDGELPCALANRGNKFVQMCNRQKAHDEVMQVVFFSLVTQLDAITHHHTLIALVHLSKYCSRRVRIIFASLCTLWTLCTSQFIRVHSVCACRVWRVWVFFNLLFFVAMKDERQATAQQQQKQQ